MTGALKNNVNVANFDRLGSYGPYDAYQNTFVPFQTGKYQFMSYISFARCISALYRGINAFRCKNSQTVNAIAVGDCLGDSVELLLLSHRYGGGVRRVAISVNLLTALFYIRLLLFRKAKNAKFGAILQTFSLSAVFPLWYYVFTRQTVKTKHFALISFFFVMWYALPKTALLMQEITQQSKQLEKSEEDKFDDKILMGTAGVTFLTLLLKAKGLLNLV
jgi:hypothetical protein